MYWTPEKIRQFRNMLKLTQDQLADKLGIGRQQTISEWEVGYYKPSPQSQKLLTRVLAAALDEAPRLDVVDRNG